MFFLDMQMLREHTNLQILLEFCVWMFSEQVVTFTRFRGEKLSTNDVYQVTFNEHSIKNGCL